ncbi:MAG: hypothetical protein EP330_05700 [Deltaproteobacteria bacterium]|nr:MAG: hypothetical protein EP330_05700 [Deltaproteobacteria bacterium]
MWWCLLPALAFEGDVLFLGNSYTFYNDLPAQVDGLLDGNAATGLTAGGIALPDHLARIEGGNARWQAAFDGQRWGVVVLQDQSQIPGFPDGQPEKQASLAAIPALDALAADSGAQTLLFLTWGRRDGDGNNPSLFPSFSAMQDRLDAGYLTYRERVEGEGRTPWIAPIGPAFRRVHDDIVAAGADPMRTDSAFWALYADDGSHPSPQGSWLAASVMYASLTGCDPTERTTDLLPAEPATALAEVARRVVLDGEDGGLGLTYPWADAPCGGLEPAPEDPVPSTRRCGCAGGQAGLWLLLPLAWRRRR